MTDNPDGSGPFPDDPSSASGPEDSSWAMPDSSRSVLGDPPPETDEDDADSDDAGDDDLDVGSAPESKAMPEVSSSLEESQVSPRPEPVDDDSKALSASVSQARKRLGEMVGDGNRKIAELKAAGSSFEEAVDRLEREVQTTHAVLERNEALAQQASRLLGEGQKLEELQNELEEQIAESDERIAAATQRVEELRDLRAEVEEKAAGFEEEIAEEQEKLATAKERAQNLENRIEEVQQENHEVEGRIGRLNEKLERLEQLRSSFLDELDSVQGALSEAMSMPAASTRVSRPRSAPSGQDDDPSAGGDAPEE